MEQMLQRSIFKRLKSFDFIQLKHFLKKRVDQVFILFETSFL